VNNKEASILFLGTGGSMGIPVIGCTCPICRSSSPRNQRLRPSAFLTVGNKRILIDAGPDFRTQALKHGIQGLDGVIFTHAHHDHTAGIDDLRVFYMWTKKSLPCLVSQETAQDIKDRYKYIFEAEYPSHKLVSRIDLEILEGDRGDVLFLGEKIHYFSFEQAEMKVTGFRFGNLGFVSDIRKYPESIFEDLNGVEILILSALRFNPSPLHFSIGEAIEFANKLEVSKTWLTHLSHEVDHDVANRDLPSNVSLAYDGLIIKFRM
jgi:phosphoribosyl 1,2-cyclic phosphate phosphodiesterase